MRDVETLNAGLSTCRLEPVYLIAAELAERDDARVRQAAAKAVGPDYGPYRGVAFESAGGTQLFTLAEGSRLGAGAPAVETPVSLLTFSIPRDAAALAKAIEAIRWAHSYEEPVITAREALATRATGEKDRDNPNRRRRRGFEVQGGFRPGRNAAGQDGGGSIRPGRPPIRPTLGRLNPRRPRGEDA
ncbi:MAG: hypothetical protein AAGF90_19950, partial [Pseudomonadota bacterium]